MSTSSMIWIKLRKEDYGKTIKCDVNKLPYKIDEFNYPCEQIILPGNETDEDVYIGVYCHQDGYPEGVGEELNNNYSTYDNVLNLISLGDLSYIVEGIKSYHNWRNEPLDYKILKTEQPKSYTWGYAYVFENNEWKLLTKY